MTDDLTFQTQDGLSSSQDQADAALSYAAVPQGGLAWDECRHFLLDAAAPSAPPA